MSIGRPSKAAERPIGSPPQEVHPNSLAALRPLAARLDRLPNADELGLARALALVTQIDQAAAPLLPRLTQEFLSDRQQRAALDEDPLWEEVDDYLTRLIRGYRWCLVSCWGDSTGMPSPPAFVAQLTAQAIRACATRLKWSHLRDMPIVPQQWGELAEIYARAERAGLARTQIDLQVGVVRRTSPEQELLKALALAAGCPGGLTPVQVEIAERLIAACAGDLAFAQRSGEPVHYFFDLAGAEGPQRLPRGTRMPASARGIVLSRATVALKQIAEELDSGLLTGADLNLGHDFDLELAGATARHLLHYWDQLARERRHVRRAETARLAVVHGFGAVAAAVVGADLAEPVEDGLEYWLARDRSETGFLAEVGQMDGTWVQVGSLLAFRYPSQPMWHAGIVRRVRQASQGVRQVGVEKVVTGTAPVSVKRRFGNPDESDDKASVGMLLVDPSGPRESICLLLPPGTYSATVPLEMQAREAGYLLIPVELAESGHGYQIARFKLLKVSG